ncbi:MAG: 4Fe-4S binding protein, partial [Fidelibacterota bacterium]
MKYIHIQRVRLISQIVFLSLFIFLILKTEFRGSFKEVTETLRISYPVKIFLELDPLVSITTAISTHSLYRGLIWSLIIIVGTIILGRFFCGWICPLGTLNHFSSTL